MELFSLSTHFKTHFLSYLKSFQFLLTKHETIWPEKLFSVSVIYHYLYCWRKCCLMNKISPFNGKGYYILKTIYFLERHEMMNLCNDAKQICSLWRLRKCDFISYKNKRKGQKIKLSFILFWITFRNFKIILIFHAVIITLTTIWSNEA